MSTAWYVVKVLPGKERSLTEQFNKDIDFNEISIITIISSDDEIQLPEIHFKIK